MKYKVKTNRLRAVTKGDVIDDTEDLWAGLIERNPQWFEKQGYEFGVGDFITAIGTFSRDKYVMHVQQIANGTYRGYGTDNGRWISGYSLGMHRQDFREATEEERAECLLAGAKSKYGDDPVSCLLLPSDVARLDYTRYQFNEAGDFYIGAKASGNNMMVWREMGNEWAEKGEVNFIGDYKVERTSDYVFKIGCERDVDERFINTLSNYLEKHDLRVILEDVDITEDIIKLDRNG